MSVRIRLSLVILSAVACGDDAMVTCPEPLILTERGCEAPIDAGADTGEGADASADSGVDAPSDVNPTADASSSDAALVDTGPVEVCNGADDDGDEEVDEGLPTTLFYLDNDNDSFGVADSTCMACSPNVCGNGNWVENSDDCDDACDACFPGGSEVCDERNNDCDMSTDEGVTNRYFEDLDRDQFGSDVFVDACARPDGYAIDGGDCADMEPRAYPGASAYRAEPMTNPPASGLAFDYNCDGMETHEIVSVGNPFAVCSSASCPENDRWEDVLPRCGGFGSVFRCFGVGLNCTALEGSEERALCR